MLTDSQYSTCLLNKCPPPKHLSLSGHLWSCKEPDFFFWSINRYFKIATCFINDISLSEICKFQKQSSGCVLQKRCSEKFRNCNFIKKETLAQVQVFSCEFFEISKNTFFYRTPPVAASEVSNVICIKYFYQLSVNVVIGILYHTCLLPQLY